MGMCFCGKEYQDQREQARLIEQQLKNMNRQETDNQFTLLLLGTGDSGKSTFCKQLRLLHDDGFTEREFFTHRNVLQENALVSMQKLLLCGLNSNLNKSQDESSQNPQLDLHLYEDSIQTILRAKELTPKVAEQISHIWTHSNIGSLLETNRRLHLSSATDYYFDNAIRFSSDTFTPNEEDILRSRAQTTGISETKFQHNDYQFTVVDVGGQRSERRKWLHCFDKVTCVIYLAALDEYDMILQEDDKTNRLEESVNLFHEVSGSNWFKETPFILFLNKSDLFEKKIKKYPLSGVFPELKQKKNQTTTTTTTTGEDDMDHENKMYEEGVEFIKKKYQNGFNGMSLYVFVTCAVDKNKCMLVFDAVQDIILRELIRPRML